MSILSFLVNLFHKIFGGLTPEQKEIVKISSDIINTIKSGQNFDEALENVLALVPEDLKSKFLSNIVPILHKAGLIPSLDFTIKEAIVYAGGHLKTLDGDLLRNVKLNNLGYFLIDVFADGKIDWNDLAHLPKLFFSHQDELDK